MLQPVGIAPTAFQAVPATVRIDGQDYPNPLRFDNGTAVTTAAEWEGRRRAELLAQFRQNVYGQDLPLPTAETVQVTSTAFPGGTRKVVKITVTGPRGTGSFPLTLFVPKTVGKPKGTFLLIDHRGSVSADPAQSSGYAPVATIVKAGYAFASFKAGDIAPDDNGTYRNKMINLFYRADQPLPDNAGRTISAWAWGASRVLDYFETDPAVDAKHVALIGHSRLGKTVLWAGAQDPRFAVVLSSCAGEMGSSLARRDFGETVDDMATGFPWQFAGNFQAFIGHWTAMPTDTHMVIALNAPHGLYIDGGVGDQWSDPEGEFLGEVAAGPAYRLVGKKDLGTSTLPAVDHPLIDGDLAFQYHHEAHVIAASDWQAFLQFAARYLQPAR